MNSRIVKIAMIVMVAATATGSYAVAGQGQGRDKGKHGEMIQKAIARLNLTADQQARIKAIRDNFKTTNAAAIEQVRTLRTQMQAARKSGDKEQAKAIQAQMKTRMEALRPARQQMIEQIKAVLTAEQRAELEKMMAEKKGKHGQKDRQGKKGEKVHGQGKGAAKQKNAPAID